MASYVELYDLRGDTVLRNKVRVAVTKKAQTLIDKPAPTQDELNWANAALGNMDGQADKIFSYVVVANSAASVAAIQGASDAAIQTNVDEAVDKLISGSLI